MAIHYTITPHDGSAYKSLICGRTDDITRLMGYIAKGHSVAVFGERRIGKTSILYLLRDIINGQIDSYRENLIDLELSNAITDLKARTPNCKAIFLNPHDLGIVNSEQFTDLLHSELQANDLLPQSQKSNKNKLSSPVGISPLIKVFRSLNENLSSSDKRAVILIDEMEVLLELTDSKQISRNLRSVIQSCSQVCLILTGAEYWYRQIKDKSSPLVPSIQPFYLKAPSQFSIENYLISRPLKEYFAPNCEIGDAVYTVIEWSGCKPCYVQGICGEIINVLTPEKEFPENWQDSVRTNSWKTLEYNLNAFYIDENLDKLSQKILALLANKPGLTVKEITQKLGESEREVWNKVDDLEALDKVRKQGADYRIVGTLIEHWGQKTREIPPIKSPWPQTLRWLGAAVLLILAIWTYFYVYPTEEIFSFDFPDGTVQVRMPASLEQEESGTATISVYNTSSTGAYSATLSLVSTDIEYRKDGSSQVAFETISINEAKFWSPEFTSHSPASGNAFISKVVIINNASGSSTEYEFGIPQRVLPIKKYWGLVSFLLVTVSGFITKRDLTELAKNLLAVISK